MSYRVTGHARECRGSIQNRAGVAATAGGSTGPDGDEYHAYCPALKRLHTCGDTREEAARHAADAALAYLEALIAYGDPIPLEAPENEGDEVAAEVAAVVAATAPAGR